MDPFTGYIIGSGVSAATSLITNRMNERASDRAFQHDFEMLKYQNEYNNPRNQMRRLRDAGLNPHLVYGGGNVTGNLTGSLPKYQVPEKRFDTGITGESAVGALGMYQDISYKKVAEDKVQSEIVTEKLSQANLAIKNLRDAFELNKAHKLEPYQLDLAKETVKKLQMDIINTEKLGRLREEEISTKKEQRLNIMKQRELIAAQIGMLDISKKEKEYLLGQMKKGIYPNTAGWMKLAMVIAENLGMSIDKIRSTWAWVPSKTSPGGRKKVSIPTWKSKGYHKGQFPEPKW